jgi:hypothetical protein
MLKQTAERFNAGRFTDTAIAASRQVWLAGLGAAMVTRDWARNDAGHVFRSLVKEGASVESHAKRVIGKQLDASIAAATDVMTKARTTALSTVNGLVDTAVAALPKLKPYVAAKSVAPVKAKSMKRRVARKARRGKRSATKA